MKFIHVFYVFSPLHVILNSPPSGTFSHFVYFNFLALFFVWFGFVCITSENQLFPHRNQRSISFSCCALLCPISSLITLLPLLCFLTLPILDFSPPFLLSLQPFLVLSPHPSCQAGWGTPLGRCWQTAAGLFAGLYQVGTPTKESFGSPATLLTGVIPPLHFRVAYTVPLSKLWKMKVWHSLGSICQHLMSYICFLVLGGCAEIRSHHNNSKIVRIASAALAGDLVLPALLSLRKRTF